MTTTPTTPTTTPTPKDFQGKRALVTGASSGIGKATAQLLAARGAFVGVHCNSNLDGANETLKTIRSHGGDGVVLQADLSDTAAAANLVDEFAAVANGMDVLINNAGSPVKRASIEECDLALFQNILRINLTSVFVVTQRAIPHLRESGKGAIVNNLSLSVFTGGSGGGGVYALAKGAVQVMTRTLARELAPVIRTNAIMPGVIETPHHDTFSTPQKMIDYASQTPMGRNGQADEVAQAAVFLASDAAAFINGALLDINGGRYLR